MCFIDLKSKTKYILALYSLYIKWIKIIMLTTLQVIMRTEMHECCSKIIIIAHIH